MVCIYILENDGMFWLGIFFTDMQKVVDGLKDELSESDRRGQFSVLLLSV